MANESARPRRSRVGLALFLVVSTLLAWEAVNAIVPAKPPRMTASRFLRAAWAVANGETGAIDVVDIEAEKFAFRPLPYVMYGYKPSFTRKGDPLRTSNTLGFRGPEIELPKPAGRYRIVCLGGSTTYSYFVPDDETYPVHLQQELRERRSDLDVEVVNAGVESYTSAESLANLAFRVLDLQPDAIVIYQSCNDVRPRKYKNFESSYAHYRKPWSGDITGFREVGGELNGINFFIQYPPPQPPGRDAENVANAGTWAYRRNLTSLVGIAKAHGVLPILVTFAATEGPDPVMSEAIAEQNGVLREVAAAQSVPCVDFAPRMPLEERYFADQVHVTVDGARLKAQLIAEDLAGLLP